MDKPRLSKEIHLMKRYLVAAVLIVSFATPASAAPQWVYDRCWNAAVRVKPVLRYDDVEAWVANCIADWTAGTPPPPRGSKNTNRNRY
jgi:hypothetical protein